MGRTDGRTTQKLSKVVTKEKKNSGKCHRQQETLSVTLPHGGIRASHCQGLQFELSEPFCCSEKTLRFSDTHCSRRSATTWCCCCQGCILLGLVVAAAEAASLPLSAPPSAARCTRSCWVSSRRRHQSCAIKRACVPHAANCNTLQIAKRCKVSNTRSACAC